MDIDPNAEHYMDSSPNVEFICSNTIDFAKEIHKRPFQIDLLFIDADHSKEAVLQDFYNFFPLVASNGIVLLHDTYPGDETLLSEKYCNNAYMAIDDLTKDISKFEMVTIPVSPGLTICRKREKHLLWK